MSHSESRGLCTRQRAQPAQRPGGGTVPGFLEEQQEMTGVNEGRYMGRGILAPQTFKGQNPLSPAP